MKDGNGNEDQYSAYLRCTGGPGAWSFYGEASEIEKVGNKIPK